MKFEETSINPSLAKEYLKRNLSNRKIDKTKVKLYADCMTDGKWVPTGETIKFDIRNKLIDGQHRLLAIIQSGLTVIITVCTGLPLEAFSAIDQGKKRTFGDVFHVSSIKNPNETAAVVQSYLKIKSGIRNIEANSDRLNIIPEDALKEYNSRPELYHTVVNKSKTWKRSIFDALSIANIGGYYLYFYTHFSQEEAETFFKMLCEGIGFDDKSHPIAILRSRLIAVRNDKEIRFTQAVKAAYIIKTWNYYRKGVKSLGALTYKVGTEQFPIAI